MYLSPASFIHRPSIQVRSVEPRPSFLLRASKFSLVIQYQLATTVFASWFGNLNSGHTSENAKKSSAPPTSAPPHALYRGSFLCLAASSKNDSRSCRTSPGMPGYPTHALTRFAGNVPPVFRLSFHRLQTSRRNLYLKFSSTRMFAASRRICSQSCVASPEGLALCHNASS